MIYSIIRTFLSVVAVLTIFLPYSAIPQSAQNQVFFYSPDPAQRAFDSLTASRIPLLPLRPDALAQVLPDSLDNSKYMWFPGIIYQYGYFACQQYSGSAYTFAYEINRLRNVDGTIPENKYAPHYMWHFFNQGEQYVGVNFLHTFHAMMEQGHMSNSDFGLDTALLSKGWITGYDKYYRAMKNRIRNIYAIPVNSAEGIQAVKQYLFDHLDGSSTGGVACFTASSPGLTVFNLPANTPEAGKHVLKNWQPYPTHGMTIVGYHDSIRYDINQDGRYTNDNDITGDGIIDARDWEIGGFLLANSYGNWWADGGYFYVLYHAMASSFEQGGVWNNCVYIVEPDPDYTPLLTLKADLSHNKRNQLNIIAGVSTDLQADYPDHILEPPIFTYQGGSMYMQGFDSLPEQKRLEFGLDVTPLLSYLTPGVPAKFFLVLEERDPMNTGEGILHEASFIHYGTTTGIFPCTISEATIRNNGTTILSATGTVVVDFPVIMNETLPPFSPSGTCVVQFQASGGESPYSWIIHQPYQKVTGGSAYDPFTDLKLTPQSSGKPYAKVPLPFEFPFFGKLFDTLYVNAFGMIQFSDDHLPYPYLCSATDMLDYISAMTPSFSWDYAMRQGDGDGMWMSATPDSVRFRWKLSQVGVETQTNFEFGITLFPDGTSAFCYGPVQSVENGLISWCGISSGDKYNTLVTPVFDLAALSGTSCTWIPPTTPGTVSLTPEGSLTITGADTGMIYDLPVRVTDDQGISSEQLFQLSSGLLISHELSCASGHLQKEEPASLSVQVTNNSGSQVTDILLSFYCDKPELMITNAFASAGQISAGQSVSISSAFSFILQSGLPDKTLLPCRIEASAEGRTWEYRFYIPVSAINLQVTAMEVQDGVNALLDAGEVANLVFTLSNRGSIPAENLTVHLSTGDEFLEILSSASLPAGTLGKNGMYDAVFTVKASRDALPGHLEELELLITDGSDIEIIHPCSITIGTRPVALLNLAGATTSVSLMAGIMDSIHVGYDLHMTLPEDLNKYPIAFIILGSIYPGSYALTLEETDQLINYLNNGGNVYMEGYSAWYYGSGKLLTDVFMFSTERVSVYYFDELTGVDGTFTDGMDFPYTGASPYAIFEVIPKGEGFSLMQNNDTPPKCVEFAYAGEQYKTIGTFKEFGQLSDSEPPSRKAILFNHYLDFLEVNINGPFPFFHADTTHLCQWHTVQFTDDSFDNITSWHWEFPGGTPSSSEQPNPMVQYHSTGVYDVILTVSDGVHTQTMHKKRYIHINVCAGMEEPVSSNEITIYPNPANEEAWIIFAENIEGAVHIDLLDLRGMVVRHYMLSVSAENQTCRLDLSALNAGVYIVRFEGEKSNYSKKLVIY